MQELVMKIIHNHKAVIHKTTNDDLNRGKHWITLKINKLTIILNEEDKKELMERLGEFDYIVVYEDDNIHVTHKKYLKDSMYEPGTYYNKNYNDHGDYVVGGGAVTYYTYKF